MMKKVLLLLLVTLVVTLIIITQNVTAHPEFSPRYSTAYELIDEVNQLRADRGLYAYNPHPILMGIAQTHAEYLASIGVSNTHIDAYGRRPFQRALDAGYPVAGDLTLGGFISENVVGGSGLTAEGAIEIWINSEPHLKTMVSTDLEDVGAGVATFGTTYYYVLVAGLSTGGTPRPYAPEPYILVNTPTIATNTPNPDGAIIHVVLPGDTLLEIAIAYDVSLAELYALNGLNEKSIIYPDQQIIVRSGNTPTPTQPTSTPTNRPSSTPWPTTGKEVSTPTYSPSVTREVTSPPGSAGQALLFIIVAAILAAAVLTLAGCRKKG
jgi:uncharacterized protein YkwD